MIGIEDPDDQVAGRGARRLRDAGVDVTSGVLVDDIARQLAPYLTHRRTGRPHVVLKLALTLDGYIAAPDGSSTWITGAAARADAHRLRAESDAVLVGAGTVRADDPLLTVRNFTPANAVPAAGLDPLRVVLGRVPQARASLPRSNTREISPRCSTTSVGAACCSSWSKAGATSPVSSTVRAWSTNTCCTSRRHSWAATAVSVYLRVRARRPWPS